MFMSTHSKGSLREELGHLTAGLSKLEEASSTVDDLSKNAVKKKKELQIAQARHDNSLEMLLLRRGAIRTCDKKRNAACKHKLSPKRRDLTSHDGIPYLTKAKLIGGKARERPKYLLESRYYYNGGLPTTLTCLLTESASTPSSMIARDHRKHSISLPF